mmetsp:Transcript_118718/g.347763  ORF Transcript_118718/g.347763 Transcript_118718/m.347763 type:complete len:228 (-) Transcript_118718:558-1241(-)
MPDTLVRDHHWVHDALEVDGTLLPKCWHIAAEDAEEHGLQVLRRATQPVLEGEHEASRILRLVSWQELQDFRERAYQLQQAVLKGTTCLLLLPTGQRLVAHVLHLLGKVAERAARDCSQVERAQLVELHDVGHGGKAKACIQLLPDRAHHLHQLVSKLLHKDQGADKDVRIFKVIPKVLESLRVADLFKQIAGTLDTQRRVTLVEQLNGIRHGSLVLGLQHNIHNFA